MSAAWSDLADELARWRDAGREAPFWLRDDDAVEPTPALERLLDLTEPRGIPLTLAVIPAHTGEALADRLAGTRHVAVAVHGWAHINHAPAGRKKCELGLDRAKTQVLAELGKGLEKLHHLHGPRALPLLVPPWNRIDDALIADLPASGFSALSTFGPPKEAALPMLNTSIDIIDWHGSRGGRDPAALIAEILAQLRLAEAGGPPVGVLTHHLVHDGAAWDFLERLFDVPGIGWLSARQALARGQS